jgi:hypothetical protein
MSASNHEPVSLHLKHGLALPRDRPFRLCALSFEKFGVKLALFLASICSLTKLKM